MQHRIKMAKDIDEACEEESNEMPDIPSTIPFLNHVVSFIYNVANCLELAVWFRLTLCDFCCHVDTKDIEAALPHKFINDIYCNCIWGPYCTHGKFVNVDCQFKFLYRDCMVLILYYYSK